MQYFRLLLNGAKCQNLHSILKNQSFTYNLQEQIQETCH
jgi:hypothetical protein